MAQPSLPYLDLSYQATWWRFTSSVRVFVEAFCGQLSDDGEFGQKVAMAAHELVENAVKYCQAPSSPVRLELGTRGTLLSLRVTNPASAPHIDVLRREFAYVLDGDPLEIYIIKLQSNIYSDTSRLGLARIRYEADATIHLETQDAVVTMEAIFAIPERAAQHAEFEQPSV